MDSGRNRRIGYPHVVSTVALFVALGGSAFAVSKIDSGEIQNNTIVSKDLKNKKAVKGTDVADGSLGAADLGDGSVGAGEVSDGSLGSADLGDNSVGSGEVADNGLSGADIDESSLGQVPSAVAADSSKSVVPIFARAQAGTGGATDQLLVSHGPFTIKGRCQIANANQNTIALEATTSEDNSFAVGRDPFGPDSEPDFDSTENFEVFGYQEGAQTPAGLFPVEAGFASPSGRSVTLSLAMGTRVFSDDPAARTDCIFTGFAVLG